MWYRNACTINTERVWRTIDDMARCILIESKLNEPWWQSARETAEYIYNRVVSASNEPPPFTQFYGTRDSLSHLRIFGSKCYVNIPLQLRTADHSAIAQEGILIGYGPRHILSYKIYVPSLNILLITNDCVFQEYDENGEPYEQLQNNNIPVTVDPIPRDINDYKYLIGTLHWDQGDHLLYITKKVATDENNNIIAIRKCIGKNNKEIGKMLYNDPIMIADIVKMTKEYQEWVKKRTSSVLHPRVFENLNGIPSEVFSMSLNNDVSKKRKFPASFDQGGEADAVKGMRFLNLVSQATINYLTLPHLITPDQTLSPNITLTSSV